MLVNETAVLDLAASEVDFFHSFRRLILRSAENIKSENMEELMSTLQEKQTMIFRYNVIMEEWNRIGLSLEIKDGYNNPDFWSYIFQIFPADSSEKGHISGKLKLLVEQKKTLIEELLKIEDDSQEVLNDYVKRLRSRISQVSKGRNACKGYAAASGVTLLGR